MGAAAVIPILRVADAVRSRGFYLGVLEFEEEWEDQFDLWMPRVVALRRGDARLFLTEHDACPPGALVYVVVDDVDRLHARIAAAGLAARWGPGDQPWGMRELEVRDPDGNTLRFAAPVQRDAEPHAGGVHG